MTYHADSGLVEALRDITFSVDRGELVALVGPSGCGKSTVLRVVAGLRPATAGRIAVDGRRPATTRSNVDLPQPDGPTSATSSPRATLNVMSRSASTGPESA